MAREVLSNGVINPDKYQADWYADLSNNWNLLNNLIGSAITSSQVDSKIATAIAELMVRTFQIVAELPQTGTEGVMYLVLIPNTSKYTAYVWESNAYRELGVIQMTITIDDELSTTSENPAQNKVITNALNGKANISHTHSASDITSGLATVATSGSYNDLSNKPTIPTKTSDLSNDSGFITEDNTKIPLAGSNAISGSLIPATTDAYDLGGSSYQWNNAYIKSLTINGVACGDILTHNASEFVDVTSAQTIGGPKTFSKIALKSSRIERGVLPSSNITEDNEIEIVDKNNRRILGIFNYYYANGKGRTGFYAYNPNTTDYDNVSIAFDFDNINNQKSLMPVVTNTIGLGTPTNKWKSLNGINPGALSLPGASYINLDTTDFDTTSTTIGTFTPTVDGWVILNISQKNKHFGIWMISGAYRATFHTVINNDDYFIFALMPVRADVTTTIYCTANDIDSTRNVGWLRFFPCPGNV